MIGMQRQDQMSARSKAGAKWLSKVKRGQVVPKGKFSKKIYLLKYNLHLCKYDIKPVKNI